MHLRARASMACKCGMRTGARVSVHGMCACVCVRVHGCVCVFMWCACVGAYLCVVFCVRCMCVCVHVFVDVCICLFVVHLCVRLCCMCAYVRCAHAHVRTMECSPLKADWCIFCPVTFFNSFSPELGKQSVDQFYGCSLHNCAR